ncbi:MAG: PAS domain S-box protein [Bacteroidales bacterium]|nr:PAS domain S-box protein [Bacteroidales bacterium]
MSSSSYVVGIGASAGGLEAIQQLFDYLPDDTGMSFIIIQHLSPNFKSLMPELLAKHTRMEIFTSENEQEIRTNCIYLNKSNKDLVVKDGKLLLKDKDPNRHLNLPIDMFFHSLAVEYQEKAIAVVLSGTGSDGSRGIRSIKETGGTTLVQDPESAQFNGMPNTAIATNLAEYILPPDKIAKELIKLTSKSIHIPELVKSDPDESESTFNNILEEIYKSSGIDFRQYKHNTLIRRLEKRMTINNVDSLEQYYDLIHSIPAEKEMLKKDFLISVTSFFRDIDAFLILKEKVIEKLIFKRPANDTIRVWVAGCATGEEAYSIAILLDELIEKSGSRLEYKIFATDVDIDALKIAGFGTYPVNIATDISNERLEKYFVKTGDKFQISKKVREKIVFSYHNILKDPPFVRMDLITCRNLLIYLGNRIQRKILLNFQFAVKNQGFLFLGSSESLGDLQKYFQVVDTKWKIFKNISDQKVLPSYIMPEEKLQLFDYKSPITISQRAAPIDRETNDGFFYRHLSELYAPSCLVVDADYNLVFTSGNAKKYLHFHDGVFNSKLFNLAPKELLPVFRSGLKKVREKAVPVQIQNVKVRLDEEYFETNLTFRSLIRETDKNYLYIIEFGDKMLVDSKEKKDVYKHIEYDDLSKHRIDELEDELKLAKNELQNVIEELETSNEELQSSNEELLASNEELQSTNEELQSVNEELYTVNTELQEKNKELLNLNSDVNNLLNSTEIGTLFLDNSLNIRKFTPSLKKHFNLREEDIGRHINTFTSNFTETTTEELISDAEKVLKDSSIFQKEIQDKEGHYYLLRFNPFISPEKRTDGVVITLTNITALKQTENELTYRKNLLTSAIKNLPGALVFLYDRNLDLLMADGEELYEMGLSPEQMVGKKLKDYLPAGKAGLFEKHYQEAFTRKKKIRFESQVGSRDFIFNAIPINSIAPGKNTLLVLAVNTSDIKAAKAELLKLNQAVFQAPSPIVITNLKGEITYVNPKFEHVTGYDSEEIKGKSSSMLKSGFHAESFYQNLWDTITKGKTWRGEFFNRKKNGKNYWELASISPLKNKKGKITGFVKVSEDVTELKRIEAELKEAKEKAEIANIYKNNFLANMSHEIRTPMNGIIGFSNLLKNTGLTTGEKEEYVRIIHNNSLQLLNLIDDIIDISKIEAGELKTVSGECHIIQVLNELKIIFEHERDLQKKNIMIKLHIPEGYDDLVIKTDSIRIKQILTNLLSNALKFTQEGSIEMGFEVISKDIRFFVKDTGIGIPSEKLEIIFNRFEQSEINISKKFGGTGLGLSISKGLVNLLGGKIWVESIFDIGSEFIFTIPFKRIKTQNLHKTKNSPESFKDIENRNVLVVEDDDIVFEFLKIVLTSVKVNVDRAENGLSAIDKFRNSHHYDLILMDIGLPDIDGYTVVEEVLKMDKNIKIIAQTAYAMQDDIDKCYSVGCHDYISKPINPDLLILKMKNLL